MIAGGNGSSTPIDVRDPAAASNFMKNTVSHGGAEKPVPAAGASHRRRTKALGVGRWDRCLFRAPVACHRRVQLEFGILARKADLGLGGVLGPQRDLRHSLAREGRPARSFQVDLACSVIAERARHAGPLRSICPDVEQKGRNPHISEFSREW